jgi:plastocyanin
MNYNLPITRHWTVATVLVLSFSVGALGVNACFSDRATTDATTSTAACSAPANTAGSTVIFITAFTFLPATVHVKAGESVAWVNCEPTAISHTSTSDGAVWESGLLAPTKDFVRTFAAAGTFPYHCSVHPSMKATIIVD